MLINLKFYVKKNISNDKIKRVIELLWDLVFKFKNSKGLFIKR